MDIPTIQGFAAIAAGLAIFVLMYAIYSPKRRSSRNASSNVVEEVFGNETATGTAEGLGKYVQPILRNFMPQLPEGIVSKSQETKYRTLLRHAGNPWKITPEELFVLQLAFAAIGAVAGLFVAVVSPLPQIPIIAWPIVLALLGALLPYGYHTGIREKRRKNVQKLLPESLDLMTVLIRSGQTFEPALRRVTTQIPEGFLREEFTRINLELQAGTSLADAMRSFAANTDAVTGEKFAKAIIQAQVNGADVTSTLQQQASLAREDYVAMLDRMIARLGTTMFIPLAACMLPAFSIIFIAPAIASLSGFLN